MSSLVCRFAPSPNGYLHLGHALSGLMNFDLARAADGRFLLRIEDIDQARCRAEFEAAIYEDLAWLGVTWEAPVRRQSEHLDDYRAALARLEALGLIYPSFESRAEIAALVAAGAPHALRLDMAAALARVGADLAWTETGSGPDGETGTVAAAPARWGDVVLGRKDVPVSYHLAVVIDDARQGVTHVVRGRDLFWSTSVHRLLQALLDLPAPVYHHHRLVLDPDGRKLSKSTQATALRSLRHDGVTAAAIRRMVDLQ
jgi:glutamyl-Q tRNA(Asp) synthetase